MIIKEQNNNINLADEFGAKTFGISDTGFVLEILRKKLYSNIIAAICREISCNARDANREAGNENIPIEITLPTYNNLFFTIKDSGIGISPERINDVFINYGKSTKRDSNEYMGFYGLGSKTPFGYGDNFSIITIHNGIKYNYAAMIDETQSGKLLKLSEYPTTENSGTSIIVPVLSSDIHKFKSELTTATQYWKLRPTITNDVLNYVNQPIVVQGSFWNIAKDYHQKILANIDGIIYPINYYIKNELIYALPGSLTINFKIGELSVSANRESLFFDESTILKINQTLASIELEIFNKVQKEMNEQPDFWAAQYYYNQLQNLYKTYSLFQNIQYSGERFLKLSTAFPCKIIHVVKNKKISGFSIKKRLDHYLQLTKVKQLFVNDTSITDFEGRQFRKIFDANPGWDHLQIICPTEENHQTIEWLNKHNQLEKLNPIKLSHVLPKAKEKKERVETERFIFYKFDKDGKFHQSSLKAIKEDINKKIIGLYSKSGMHQELWYKNKYIARGVLQELMREIPGTSFYGCTLAIDDDKISKIGFDASFTQLLDDYKLKIDKNKFLKERFFSQNDLNLYSKTFKFLKLISPLENSDAFKLKSLYEEIKNREAYSLYYLHSAILDITKQDEEDFALTFDTKSLVSCEEEFYKKYPLIKYLLERSFEREPVLIEEMKKYINQVDGKVK